MRRRDRRPGSSTPLCLPVLLTGLLGTCSVPPAARPAGPLGEIVGLEPAPRLLTGPTAVLFWLPAGDTLTAEERTAAREGLTASAATLRHLLGAYGIPVTGVSVEQVYVQAPGAPRRTVMLGGLDYPWGLVLVDPGYPEQIITGPVESEELEELAWDYFLLEEGVVGPERSAAAQVPARRRQNQYAGSPSPTTPRPTTVCWSGWLTMVFRTIAAADRMNSSGVQG